MAGRIKRNVCLGILTACLLILTALVNSVGAVPQPVVYKAADGFQVLSYAKAWNNQAKLKSVYEELLKNTHGEEFKLLSKVVIYPGADPQRAGAAGRWYGVWKMDAGKPRLLSNRYIEIYDGDKYTGIDSIARTLAHEYGHHFTYYYYFKKENKLWDNWRTSGLALARQLKNNSKVSAVSGPHRWLIQEIAAEDYVQLFGSPTAKKSVDFEDIEERLPKRQTDITFTSDIFNYRPQENYEIPLAANLAGLREYWSKASGIVYKRGLPPSQIDLQLAAVKHIKGINTPQYVFTWGKSSDDRTTALEYTLVRYSLTQNGSEEIYPLKTVYEGELFQAVTGSVVKSGMYMWEPVPTGLSFFVVYVKDGDGLVTSSKVLAVDFSDSLAPATVLVDDSYLSGGKWLVPRVKVRDKQLNPTVKPIIQNNVMMVPLRNIAQELGATIEWEAATATARIIKDGIELSMQIGSPYATVNEEQVKLKQVPSFLSGMMIVPLNDLCEALGAQVYWDPVLQLAQIEPL